MFKKSLHHILYGLLAITLAVMACNLTGAPGPTVAPPTVAPSPQAATAIPTAVPPTPTQPTGRFTLITPDGQRLELKAQCTGINMGEYLEVKANNSEDLSDPNRVRVELAGLHQGAGPAEMFITILIGPQEGTTFSGNNPAISVTLQANGSGSFADAAIVNIANASPTYQYGVEYKFSGEWEC